jgi:hypothetical protein
MADADLVLGGGVVKGTGLVAPSSRWLLRRAEEVDPSAIYRATYRSRDSLGKFYIIMGDKHGERF